MVLYFKTTPNPPSWGGGLSRGLAFRTEVKCLQALERNFTCSCAKQYKWHFPKVRKPNKRLRMMHLTGVGTSLDRLGDVKVSDLKEQVNCIAQNLRKNGVHHLDIYPWNVCFDKSSGAISLIDFDRAMFGKAHFEYPLRNRLASGNRRLVMRTSRKKQYTAYVRSALERSLVRSKWSGMMKRQARKQRRRRLRRK